MEPSQARLRPRMRWLALHGRSVSQMAVGLTYALFVGFAGAAVGGIIGLIVGFATEPPPDANALVDPRFFDGIFGAGIGAALAIVLLTLSALRERIKRRGAEELPPLPRPPHRRR
jgi:hypothetical protein